MRVDMSAIEWRLNMFKHEVIGSKLPCDNIIRDLKQRYNE